MEVDSRAWFLWAVIFIFLGVLASAALTNWLALRRRKKLLNRELDNTVQTYLTNRRLNYPKGEPEPRLIWASNVDGPLKVDPTWEYFDDLKSTNRIYTAIKWARNDADLDEAAAAVGGVHDAVETWVKTVKAASDLYKVNANPPFSQERTSWTDTATARQTDLLLRNLQHTPEDAKLLAALPQIVARQASWHRAFANAWELRTTLAVELQANISDKPLIDIDSKVTS
ncbi:MAG: hypothetical protein WBP81_34690, partial [Solirubrobacteraceae bacterium]